MGTYRQRAKSGGGGFGILGGLPIGQELGVIDYDGVTYWWDGTVWQAVPADADAANVPALWMFKQQGDDGAAQVPEKKNDFRLTVGVAASNCGLAAPTGKWGPHALQTLGGGLGIQNAPGNALLAFGSNDFVMEGWIQPSILAGAVEEIIDLRNTNGSEVRPVIYINSTNKLVWHISLVDRIVSTTSLTTGVWWYFAIARVSGNTRMYMGTSGSAPQEGGTYADANVYLAPGTSSRFGASSSGASNAPFLGYTDSFRITNGSGRGFSGASIAVPTMPFSTF
jgi:hypothetical protein